jgi:cytochrome c oxidase subunit 4
MADYVDPDSHDGVAHAPHQHHVSGLGMYFSVFFALCLGTILTVAASRIDLGMWNTPIALLIAVIKAVLVILFFMHVVHSSRLTWVVICGAFLWLFVMFMLTFSDYLSRALSMY